MSDDGNDLEELLESTFSGRGASAFAHAGSARSPLVRYCLSRAEGDESIVDEPHSPSTHAVGFNGSRWYHVGSHPTDGDSSHPADELGRRLADADLSGAVLTPPSIPHDAALFLEEHGLTLASSDALERARQHKSTGEREHIREAQRAAADGIERAAAILSQTTVDDDDSLVVDGKRLTAAKLRRSIDEAIVSAGALPDGHSAVETTTDVVARGESVVVGVAPAVEGYHGGLVRTFVVDGDGGPRRRAHVALTQAFRSVQSFLTANTRSVTAVEADLEAEIRAYGFGDEAFETRVSGVGLEPREAPSTPGADVGPETVVRIEAAVVGLEGGPVRLADLLAPGEPAEWLATPSRSLEPKAVLED